MTRSSRLERIVGDRLRAEAPLRAPDSLLAKTLARVAVTPQRKPSMLGRLEPLRRRPSLFGAAAITTVVVAVVGLRLLSGVTGPDRMPGGVLSPAISPTPVPTLTPRPTAKPVRLLPGTGTLEPGRYHVDVMLHNYERDMVTPGRVPIGRTGAYEGQTVRITFEVPEGWSSIDGRAITKNEAGADLSISLWTVYRVFIDPCRWLSAGLGNRADPPMMESFGSLAGALSHPVWWDGGGTRPSATAAEAATVGGLEAKTIEVTSPSDVVIEACDEARYVLFNDPRGNQRSIQEPGQIDRLWVVDIDGFKESVIYRGIPGATGVGGAMSELLGGLLVIDAGAGPSASVAGLAEQVAIVGSVEFDLLPREH